MWKVGQLVRLTGLTVRTLHHYNEIGLLNPSSHSESGHRLYTEDDIAKLEQIILLKQLGFSLEEIKEMINNPRYNHKDILRSQIEKLEEEIKLKKSLINNLKEIDEVINSFDKTNLEQFIRVIETMKINKSEYFTEDQRKKLKESYNKLTEVEINDLFNEGTELIAKFQHEMEKGTDPHDDVVVNLGRKWQQGIDYFTGGDSGIVKASEKYYMNNPSEAKSSGMSGELYRYIMTAISNIKN